MSKDVDKDIQRIKQIKNHGGTVEVRVKRSGMYQRITLKLVKQKTMYGNALVLESKRMIDLDEVERIVEEVQLPIKLPNGIFIPKGKMLKDFVDKNFVE